MGIFALVALYPRLPHGPSLTWPCGFHSLTGLPCLFCGGTRAARALSHGHWDLAFYLNPLAYLAVPLGLALIVTLAAEAIFGRSLVRWEERFLRWRPFAPILLALGLLFWLPHIVFALAAPKPELVDLRNPIAAHLRTLVAPHALQLSDAPHPPASHPDNGIARQSPPQVGPISNLAPQPGDQQHD